MNEEMFREMYGIDPDDPNVNPELVDFVTKAYEFSQTKQMTPEEMTEAITLLTAVVTLQQDRLDEVKRVILMQQEVIRHVMDHTCGDELDEVPVFEAENGKQRLMN